jgi:hypothetical protein
MFVIATALPNDRTRAEPWALGEFASDTAFLTGNQIRMAFLIECVWVRWGLTAQRARCFDHRQRAGWRALARELAGKIPPGEV